MLNNFQWLQEWSHFTDSLKSNPTYRPVTLAAWKRCQGLGLLDSMNCVFLSPEELQKKREEYELLLSVSEPYLDLLSNTLTEQPHIVALADREGWILSLKGTPELLGGRQFALATGANWSEQYIGNNGIGTALVNQEPTLVYGVEHICPAYQSCACLGVPIRDCSDNIIGALDVSVATADANPHRVSLALACGQSIEATLAKREKLETRMEEFEKLMSVGTLMATTIHDLRNPLAIIRGISQLGSMHAESQREKNYFQRIIDQVDVLSDLLGNMQSKQPGEPGTEVNLTSLIQEALTDMGPLLHVHNIKVETEFNFIGMVLLHQNLFSRALHNLLKNAIQHMQDGGNLRVQTKGSHEAVEIVITDSGPGIAKDIQDSVFRPFVTSRPEGNGLGLYQVHYVVTKVHNGTIWFETEPGKGTSFYIRIPLAGESALEA